MPHLPKSVPLSSHLGQTWGSVLKGCWNHKGMQLWFFCIAISVKNTIFFLSQQCSKTDIKNLTGFCFWFFFFSWVKNNTQTDTVKGRCRLHLEEHRKSRTGHRRVDFMFKTIREILIRHFTWSQKTIRLHPLGPGYEAVKTPCTIRVSFSPGFINPSCPRLSALMWPHALQPIQSSVAFFLLFKYSQSLIKPASYLAITIPVHLTGSLLSLFALISD